MRIPRSKRQEVRLCLTMIVKNEEAIIVRCLRSCQPALGAICITDTGSRAEDRAKEIITTLGDHFKLPMAILGDRWQNFSYNRTRSALYAKAFLSALGWDLGRTYLLLLDADMLLEIKGFDKSALTHDGYRVFQRRDSLVYSNIRLIRADHPWTCLGPTHEYWCLDRGDVGDLDTLSIDDHGDGGSKGDKFKRDISLLTEGLKHEPHIERYLFYLAESYRHTKQYRTAIDWYRKRIAREGWPEETWYARYMIGACHEALGERPQTAVAYLAAYSDRPTSCRNSRELVSPLRERTRLVTIWHCLFKRSFERVGEDVRRVQLTYRRCGVYGGRPADGMYLVILLDHERLTRLGSIVMIRTPSRCSLS